MDEYRYAFWIPTSAPNRPVSMKLPYLILATLMPASRAPSRLPPTDTVCSPQRVRVSTTCMMTVSTTAQTNGAQSPPSQCTSLVMDGGMLTGEPCEVVSTIPSRMNPVPSVVMNDGSRSATVRNALTQPIASP